MPDIDTILAAARDLISEADPDVGFAIILVDNPYSDAAVCVMQSNLFPNDVIDIISELETSGEVVDEAPSRMN